MREETMKLLIKHFPQIPCKPFEVPVENVEEAVKIMDVLADYDLFQFYNNIKPDYANITVLCIWNEEEKEWEDWYIDVDDNYFDDPHEYLEYLENKKED